MRINSRVRNLERAVELAGPSLVERVLATGGDPAFIASLSEAELRSVIAELELTAFEGDPAGLEEWRREVADIYP